jgi:hypothetical protein
MFKWSQNVIDKTILASWTAPVSPGAVRARGLICRGTVCSEAGEAMAFDACVIYVHICQFRM